MKIVLFLTIRSHEKVRTTQNANEKTHENGKRHEKDDAKQEKKITIKVYATSLATQEYLCHTGFWQES
jgi:hypothetical protein